MGHWLRDHAGNQTCQKHIFCTTIFILVVALSISFFLMSEFLKVILKKKCIANTLGTFGLAVHLRVQFDSDHKNVEVMDFLDILTCLDFASEYAKIESRVKVVDSEIKS